MLRKFLPLLIYSIGVLCCTREYFLHPTAASIKVGKMTIHRLLRDFSKYVGITGYSQVKTNDHLEIAVRPGLSARPCMGQCMVHGSTIRSYI